MWRDRHKKTSKIAGWVPTKGIEPSHPCEWQILSLLRLPIPPHGHLLNGLQYYINHPISPKYVAGIFS